MTRGFGEIEPNVRDIGDLLETVAAWASKQGDIQAVALVGSHARGDATDVSDVDLVLMARRPESYLADRAWASSFGTVTRQRVEPYGRLTSVRVWYEGCLEVEFGWTDASWVARPLDAGTRRVISRGFRVLFEHGATLLPTSTGR